MAPVKRKRLAQTAEEEEEEQQTTPVSGAGKDQTAHRYNPFSLLENEFRGCLKTYYYNNYAHSKSGHEPFIDYNPMFNGLQNYIYNLLAHEFHTSGSLKFNIVVESTYQKINKDSQEIVEIADVAFKTINFIVTSLDNLQKQIRDSFFNLLIEETNYQGKSSGWSLRNIDGLMLRINRYRPLKEPNGSSYIKLPKSISKKNCIINPQNQTDSKCFMYAIQVRHIKGKCKYRVDNRYFRLLNKNNPIYNFNNIDFPTPICQLDRFEKNNPTVSVNVYGIDDKNLIYPRRISETIRQDHFDLLLLVEKADTDDGDDDDGEIDSTAQRRSKGTTTKVKHNHVVMSYCLYFVRDETQIPDSSPLTQKIPSRPILYRGEDAAIHFLTTLTEYATQVIESLDEHHIGMYPLTREQEQMHSDAKFCMRKAF
ncbi:uncharacterized protein LOC111057545 isoform X1 [Nilaparvata lugens]|uniref:uncharacterized protein LOC111057545 isoform X1 n=1 Tax=Nilaparvata lugens TaxID=108931 RepID=UPI00193DCBD9|nr:uncharacterized protein LOC111057545 isoform X1 [Nilaparvata lugens]XP_039277359.1 uncharacterized protein LOC111057545 isoform X1 [Nilaparvata lugens]